MTATVDPEEDELANLLFAEGCEALADIEDAIRRREPGRVTELTGRLLGIATELARRERFVAETPFPGLH